ncbi:MAG TPA: AMP-binding protein, partial [Rubrivivax sp.]|nr:AMP-binding protein [Rubrivivax sp.]
MSSSAVKDPHRIVTGEEFGWRVQPLPYRSVPELFRLRVKELGDATMMRQKELGIWQAYSWNQVAAIVDEIGAGLVSLGFEPGEVASVLSNTCREWVWCDLAVQSAGGVCNGIYPTDAVSQVEYLCSDSRSVVLFVEDDEQLDKYLEAAERLPQVKRVIVFDMEGLQSFDDPRVISLQRLREIGCEYLKTQPQILAQRTAARDPAEVAVLVYTSGTTGRPKGAMISQNNIVAVLSALSATLFEGVPRGGERIAFLPLCHIAERLIGAFIPLERGSVVNYVENPETVFENLREVRPHLFFAVPRVWEKVYSQVAIALGEADKLQRAAYALALRIGAEVAQCTLDNRQPSASLALRYRLARWLVLDNVKRMIGMDRVEVGLTGAAPISPELIRWFLALGIPLREAWGMTETTGGGTMTPRQGMRPGSIGRPGPGLQLRIAEGSNEILLRGPNVILGYLNLPDKTAETIDADGWLHTGDVGRVDDDGYFYITDRMKDIIITAGGKNITPSEIENELKFSPYITDAVVIGDKRPYLVVIVMIDQENVEKYAQDHDIPFGSYASLTQAQAVQDLVWNEVERVNRKFARVEQIKKFYLLQNQLTAEDDDLTPTMKLKRKFVETK